MKRNQRLSDSIKQQSTETKTDSFKVMNMQIDEQATESIENIGTSRTSNENKIKGKMTNNEEQRK